MPISIAEPEVNAATPPANSDPFGAQQFGCGLDPDWADGAEPSDPLMGSSHALGVPPFCQNADPGTADVPLPATQAGQPAEAPTAPVGQPPATQAVLDTLKTEPTKVVPLKNPGAQVPQHRPLTNDEKQLAQYELRLDQIRDRTDGVAQGDQTGFYLVGRGGTGKTFTVRDTVERINKPWIFRNARMTPMGLFELLGKFPSHTVVLDDVGELFKKVEAQQIFLAALDGEPGKPRVVTYVRSDRQETVQFSGGIIAISNMPLRQDPVLNALRSRVITLEFEPTDEQLAAFMRHLAKKSYKDVTPAECGAVVEFIIAESKNCDQRLDLRHMTKALGDYRQWRDGRARTAWQDLVRSSLRQEIVANEHTVFGMQKERQCQIALELAAKYPGRHGKQSRDAEWTARTQTSPDAYYRSVRKMKGEGRL
jgi:hypothetical protein